MKDFERESTTWRDLLNVCWGEFFFSGFARQTWWRDHQRPPCTKCLQPWGVYCLSYQISLSQLLSLELCQAQPKLESIWTRCGPHSCTTLNPSHLLVCPTEYKSVSSCHLAHQPPKMLTLASFQPKKKKKVANSSHIFLSLGYFRCGPV